MSDLDQREDDLDVVFSILVDCPEKNVSFWELIPVIKLALKQAYPDEEFRIVIETK